MLKISNPILDLVTNLSIKSKDYIINELFQKQHSVDAILNETAQLPIETISNCIIGYLSDEQLQLFIIQQSLSKRITGTKNRIANENEVSIHESDQEIAALRETYNKRMVRLCELISDHNLIYDYLFRSIEISNTDSIKSVLEEKHTLFKNPYRHYLNEPGFIFKIVNQKTIILENKYPSGGD